MGYVNPMMLCVVAGFVVACGCVWLSPTAAEGMALVLRKRAAGVRAGRAAYAKAYAEAK